MPLETPGARKQNERAVQGGQKRLYLPTHRQQKRDDEDILAVN